MSEWKETEYGKIPDGWKIISASDYCSRVTDGTHDSPKQANEGNPLITSKHIRGREIDFSSAYLISPTDYHKIIQRSKVDQWDLIISMIGEYCGFCYLERNPNIEYAVKNVGIFKTHDEVKAKWLFYFFQSKTGKNILDAHKTGTSQPYITLGSLRNLDIITPNDSKTSQNITEVLSSLDDKIDLLHRNNKTLETMAETLFRQCFDEEAEDSFNATTLGEQYTVSRGLSYKGSGLCETHIPGSVMMLNLNSVYEGGGYKGDGIKFYNGDFKERHHVYPGDLILTNTEQGHDHRLIGYGAIVPKSIGEHGIFSQHIYRVTPKTGKLSSNYLYYLLKLPSLREQMIGATNGSTVNMLPLDGVERASILIPPPNKFREFENMAQNVQEKKESNQAQIKKLETLRDTLLPKLMNGAVKVKTN